MAVKQEQEQIEVICSVAKVTTLADQGIRVSFDFPEDAIIAVAWLMACKRDGVAVKLTIEADKGML